MSNIVFHTFSGSISISWLTIDNAGLEVLSVTAGKVAFSARGPEEPDEAVDHPGLDKLVLLPGLDADQVHAVTPANVAPRDPVNLYFSLLLGGVGVQGQVKGSG